MEMWQWWWWWWSDTAERAGGEIATGGGDTNTTMRVELMQKMGSTYFPSRDNSSRMLSI
jgi:hypothetical protein